MGKELTFFSQEHAYFDGKYLVRIMFSTKKKWSYLVLKRFRGNLKTLAEGRRIGSYAKALTAAESHLPQGRAT